MAVDIVIPEVGEVGMDVTFVRWLKAAGDEVSAGEPIFEVDTAKAIMEVEAFENGRIVDLRVQDGDLVTPHQVVAILLAPGEEPPGPGPASESAPERAPEPEQPSPSRPSAERPSVPVGRVAATPKARRRARERQIDLQAIVASGPGGLVTESDVEAFAAAQSRTPAGAEGPLDDRPELGDIAPLGTDERTARIRRAVAELTSVSWRTIPHFSILLEADVTDVLARGRPSAVLAAAVIQALVRHPEYNLGWGPDGRLVRRQAVDLGILVDTDHGLLLPAVRHAERLDIAGLEEAIREAVGRARGGSLTAEDAPGHSVTFSNLGMFAVDQFIGVIPMPDVLLISTGRIRTAPRWQDDHFVPRKVVDVTLTADHRALDGADGGRFMSILERILGDPGVLQ